MNKPNEITETIFQYLIPKVGNIPINDIQRELNINRNDLVENLSLLGDLQIARFVHTPNSNYIEKMINFGNAVRAESIRNYMNLDEQESIIEFLKTCLNGHQDTINTFGYANNKSQDLNSINSMADFLKSKGLVKIYSESSRGGQFVQITFAGKVFLKNPYNIFNSNPMIDNSIRIGDNNSQLAIAHNSQNSPVTQNISNIENLDKLYDLIEKNQIIDIVFKEQLLEEIKDFREKTESGLFPKLETFNRLWGFASDSIQILTFLGLLKGG